MQRHPKLMILGLAFAGLLSYLLTCTALSAWIFGLGHGDPRYARTWLTRFETLNDPETAGAAYEEVQFKRFPNGEWLFGVSADSHGSYWGGTIVMKDSTGKTKALFGHVCGRRRLETMFWQPKNLAELYEHEDWKAFTFKEFVPDRLWAELPASPCRVGEAGSFAHE